MQLRSPSHGWLRGFAFRPYIRIDEFLSAEGAAVMLRELTARRAEFRPRGSDPARPAFYRMSAPLAAPVEFLHRFEGIASSLERRFGTKLNRSEIELLPQAYNDGGFFGKHSDAAAGGPNWQRRLSGIYYVHAEPKSFTGGGLVVYDRRTTYVVE